MYDMNRGYAKLAALTSATASVSQISLLMETEASGIFNDWDTGHNCPDGMARVRYASGNPLRSNHSGTNVAFADGHVKLIPEGKIMNAGGRQMPVVNPANAEN